MQTETDPDEIVAVLARLPRWIVEGLEDEAEALSKSAGGVPVSRNAAMIAVLKRTLEDRRRKKAIVAEKIASPLLRKYKLLYEQGRVSHTAAAEAIGVSEATVRRWLRGQSTLHADKEAALEAFVTTVQRALHAQKTLGLNEATHER